MTDSDSLIGLAVQYGTKKKLLLEKAGNGMPQGQMRFVK